MERKLTARWFYQCSRPCRGTPKLVHCGKSTSTRFLTIWISCRPHTSEVSTEVKSTEKSSFCAGKSTTWLSLVMIPLWQIFIDSIGKNVDLKSQGILNSFNGIDIDQRREYVKVSCQSYLTRMLRAHGAGTNLLRPRSQTPSPSSHLLRLPPKSSLLQSDQPKAVLNTEPLRKDFGLSIWWILWWGTPQLIQVLLSQDFCSPVDHTLLFPGWFSIAVSSRNRPGIVSRFEEVSR